MTAPALTTRGKALKEFRRFTIRTVEVRAKDDGGTSIDIEGYASITDEPYTVSDFMGEYEEVISAGAFKKTLAEKDDVRLLFNHDGIPLARTKSDTLTLVEDSKGLKVDATLDTRSGLANDLVVALERGDLDEMSFAFKVERQEWNEDWTQRWINEVKLYDVSVVTYPANPATSVKLRAINFLNELDDDTVREILARYQARQVTQVPAAVTTTDIALRRRQLALIKL
jgi:HK97 family phage prohead protease